MNESVWNYCTASYVDSIVDNFDNLTPAEQEWALDPGNSEIRKRIFKWRETYNTHSRVVIACATEDLDGGQKGRIVFHCPSKA